MTTTPDPRDLQIAALRLSLREATQFLSYAAGRESADDPDWAQQVMDRVGDMEEVLELTGPKRETQAGPDAQP